MTLLVALVARDGMVLAADSRGTFGDPRGVTAQNDAQVKTHILAPQVAVLIAGTGPLGDLILDEVKAKLEAVGGEQSVTRVMDLLRVTVKERYDDWFRSVPAIQPAASVAMGQAAVRPQLAFLIGGYESDGKPKIFHLASEFDFAPMLVSYGFGVQGVAQYALYLLNRLYEQGRSMAELTALAVYVITETASQDGKVGGPVRVVTIKPDETAHALAPEAVERIQSDNETRSSGLRDSFYQRGEAIKLDEETSVDSGA